MNPLPETEPLLTLQCPVCGRRLRPAYRMKAATLLVKRTCVCRRRWGLKITPLRYGGGMSVHSIEWTLKADSKKLS